MNVHDENRKDIAVAAALLLIFCGAILGTVFLVLSLAIASIVAFGFLAS